MLIVSSNHPAIVLRKHFHIKKPFLLIDERDTSAEYHQITFAGHSGQVFGSRRLGLFVQPKQLREPTSGIQFRIALAAMAHTLWRPENALPSSIIVFTIQIVKDGLGFVKKLRRF